MAVNHLADKSDLEIKAMRGRLYTGVPNGGLPFPYKNIKEEALPSQFDWRIYGAVTPVKGCKIMQKSVTKHLKLNFIL